MRTSFIERIDIICLRIAIECRKGSKIRITNAYIQTNWSHRNDNGKFPGILPPNKHLVVMDSLKTKNLRRDERVAKRFLVLNEKRIWIISGKTSETATMRPPRQGSQWKSKIGTESPVLMGRNRRTKRLGSRPDLDGKHSASPLV